MLTNVGLTGFKQGYNLCLCKPNGILVHRNINCSTPVRCLVNYNLMIFHCRWLFSKVAPPGFLKVNVWLLLYQAITIVK